MNATLWHYFRLKIYLNNYKMKLELKKLGLIGTFLFSGVFMTSCLNNDDGSIVPDQSGFVVFINASPESNALKFYADGNVVNMPALDYNEFYGYLYQEVGEKNYTVRTGSTDLDTLVLDVELNRFYSLFAVNTSDSLELVAYPDNVPPISNPSRASIRFIQLSHNAPMVRVGIEDIAENFGTFSFKQASSFLEINQAINKKLFLVNSETNDTVFTKTVTLEGGKAYSVFSEGIFDSENENIDLDVKILPFQ